MKICLLLFAIACSLALPVSWQLAAEVPSAQNQKALDRLQGRWRFEWYERDGKRMDAYMKESKPRLIIKGDQWHYSDQQHKISIDPSSSPKLLDLVMRSESGSNRVLEGIFAINGNKLRICFYLGEGVKQRPTQFATQPDSQLLLYEFERVD